MDPYITYLIISQSVKLRYDIELDPVYSAVQSGIPDQQDHKHQVWERGSEIHHLYGNINSGHGSMNRDVMVHVTHTKGKKHTHINRTRARDREKERERERERENGGEG